MNLEEAMQILGVSDSDDSINDINHEYAYLQNRLQEAITLDGAFTLKELEALVVWWKHAKS